MLAADLRQQPLGSGIFLASLLGWLNADLFRISLGKFGTADGYVFRHNGSYRLSIGIS